MTNGEKSNKELTARYQTHTTNKEAQSQEYQNQNING